MNALYPPPDRDLPTGRLDDRANALLAAIGPATPAPRSALRRLAPAAAAATVLAVAVTGGVVALNAGNDRHAPHHHHAAGTPTVDPAIFEQCRRLSESLRTADDVVIDPSPATLRISLSDSAGTNWFFADASGWNACKLELGDISSGPWAYYLDGIHQGSNGWLAGYGQVDTEIHAVGRYPHRAEFYGRVSPRVASIQVTWPTGLSGTAVLANGLFLIRSSADVPKEIGAPAVSIRLYDTSGNLLQTLGPTPIIQDSATRCWIDPAKHVVLGRLDANSTTCAEAQPWHAPWN